MPFQSDAQRKFMYSQKPELAKEMAAKTPAGANLPARAASVKPEASASVAKPMLPARAAAPANLSPERKKMAMQNMVSKYGKA